MRPAHKIALALVFVFFVLMVFCFMQGIKSVDGINKSHHDTAFPSMIEAACLSYLTEYNRLPPSYDNQKLTAALLGDNSRHIVFLKLAPNQVNSDNEMVDRWGTALRINFLGTTGVQVISAGPDRLFNTPDDIVVNSPDISPSK